jgi:hypothetical protein
MNTTRDRRERDRSRNVIPGPLVRVIPQAEHVGVPPEPAPVVEPIYEGDTVLAIDVCCGCGRRMRLRCEYGPQKVSPLPDETALPEEETCEPC